MSPPTASTGTGNGLPSAPGFSLVQAQVEGATLFLTPPASNGGSVVTSFIATSNPGGITGTSDGASARIDVHGLTGGTSYTFTVQAVNANGTGAASAPSSSVTAIAYAPYWVADGNGINPAWGTNYTFNGTSNYAYSGSPFSTYPVGSSVIQMNVTSQYGGFQPYILSTAPLPVGSPNANNGIFDLTPYTNLTLSVYPTVTGTAQTLLIYFEASKWFFGTVGSGSGLTTLVDPTQNWTTNQWAGYVFTDEASGDQGSIVSNTATTLTLSGMYVAPVAGDSYNLMQPDVAIGTGVNLPGSGSYGPATMVTGQWNTYTIPLSAFNAAGSPVAGALILKFGVQDQTGLTTNTFYVTSLGFN